MIQRPSNLTPSGRRGWEYKKYWKPNECPGIAVGSFEESRPSYAILLVQSDQSDRGYRLLVFRPQVSGKYRPTTLESSDRPGAKDTFIRSVHISVFFDSRSLRQFKPVGRDGILIVESGVSQYGADVFFRTASGYQREPVEY